MKKHRDCFSLSRACVLLSGGAMLTLPAWAVDVAVSGFIRQEAAYKYSNKENELNRYGSKFNGKSYTLDGALTGTPILPIPPGALTVFKGEDLSKDNDWNLMGTKAEVDFNFGFSPDWTGFMKLRGYYMWDVFKDTRDSAFVDGEGGKVNHFNVNNHGKEPTYLSLTNNDYMFDVPAMYLDWTHDKYWVRIGQQQIAWGEALFFRVADIANGLDLRRHVFYDFGAEEYADERLSAPGIRASIELGNGWELEGFAQMFQPSILPNNYTPFNLITNGFNTDYETGFDKVDDNVNVGFRLSGQFDQLGINFFAVSRHNPDPVFNLQPSGQVLVPAAVCNDPAVPAASKALCGWETQPFVVEPGGIGTTMPTEWFYVSGVQGADGLEVINNLARDWPWITAFTQALGLMPDANGDILQTVDGGGTNTLGGLVPGGLNGMDFLELFFATTASLPGFGNGFGTSLSGTIEAHYEAENVFGFGLNYIFYAEPDTLLDQLVMRFEMNYTPDREFSNNLANDFLVSNEWMSNFVLEKYHRFSDAFPATFFVFQWMHRSDTDLLGRHLSGIGGDTTKRPGGGEQSRGWDGIVFAFQQPFPNLTWRFDTSILWDLNGGYLFQPAVRYKPRGDWTVETFVNVVDGEKGSIFQPFDFMDDITIRLTYQF